MRSKTRKDRGTKRKKWKKVTGGKHGKHTRNQQKQIALLQFNNRMLQLEIDFYKNENENIRKLCNYELLNKIETEQHKRDENYIKEMKSILDQSKSPTTKPSISNV